MLSRDEISNLPRRDRDGVSGVYFLFDGDEVVYVGKSIHLHTRVLNHRIKDFFWDGYAFIEAPADEIPVIESDYILHLRPKHNCRLGRNRTWKSASWFYKKIGDMSQADVSRSLKRLDAEQIIFGGCRYYHRSYLEKITSSRQKARVHKSVAVF